jgi:hypothetical protein
LSEYEYLILLCQSGLGGRVEVRTTNKRGRRVIYAATVVAAKSGHGSAPMSEGAVVVRQPFFIHSCRCHSHSLHALLSAHCSLLPIHLSLFTAHCFLLTALCFLLTALCSIFTARCSIFTARCSIFTALCFLLTAHCSLLSVLRLAFSLRSYIHFFLFLLLSPCLNLS